MCDFSWTTGVSCATRTLGVLEGWPISRRKIYPPNSDDLEPIHWKLRNNSLRTCYKRTNQESKRFFWIKVRCAALAIFTPTKVCGAREFIRCVSPQDFPRVSRENCERHCRQSCARPSRCAVLPSATFLTRKAS